MKRAVLIVFFVLCIDQFSKIWIKTHLHLGEEIPVIDNFFYLHFTENYGMAFGIEVPGDYGKFLLSFFRIVAVIGIGWLMHAFIRQRAHSGLLFCMSLIMGGAIGNIIDSSFYGLLFSESTVLEPASFLPEEGGYAPFLHGAVVDMFYFYSHYESTFWSSQPFTFSFPIFNFSDSAITIGVILILLFQKNFFKRQVTHNESPPSVVNGNF